MEKTKKSIFSKIFVCLSLCLVLLGALAPCFSMTKNQPLRADSVNSSYTFNGSDLITVVSSVNVLQENKFSYWTFSTMKFNIYSGPSGLKFDITGDTLYRYSLDTFGSLAHFGVTGSQITSNNSYFNAFLWEYSDHYMNVRVQSNDYTAFTANISYLKIYSTEGGNSNYSIFNTFVRYYDVNDNWLEFSIECVLNNNLSTQVPIIRKFLYDERIYYFNNPENFTDNENYNFGFNAGYSDGYNKGSSDGSKAGYHSGYNAGKTVGYNNGYNAGLNDSNQYTFINLIGSTIDAPIQYFKSLFNFELLGVNLSNFLMGLFTLCIIVTIVKLCLGR